MKGQADLFGDRLERNYPEDRFDGRTYDPVLDSERLGTQAKAVFRLMVDGRERSLRNIAAETGYPEASISARLRDFRKVKFGRYTVERRRIGGGLWLYRLVIPDA